jgi:hypothetical protein
LNSQEILETIEGFTRVEGKHGQSALCVKIVLSDPEGKKKECIDTFNKAGHVTTYIGMKILDGFTVNEVVNLAYPKQSIEMAFQS